MKIFILLLILCLPMVGVDQMPVLNIQTAMTSTDQASFGRITPIKLNLLAMYWLIRHLWEGYHLHS